MRDTDTALCSHTQTDTKQNCSRYRMFGEKKESVRRNETMPVCGWREKKTVIYGVVDFGIHDRGFSNVRN